MTQYLLLGRHQRFLEWDEVEVPEEPEPVEVTAEPVMGVVQEAAAPEAPVQSAQDALYERLQELLGQLNRCY